MSFTIDTNLHAISCLRDNASRHSQKQTMPCLIPTWWSRRPARTTWHRDNKCTMTKATAIPPHFIRTSQTTNQWRSREDQQGTLEKSWDTTHCLLREFIHTPSSKPICHNLTRHSLVRLDRVRTCYGRFKYNVNLMGLSPSASCECGAASQTAHHLASECPLHSCCGDVVTLNKKARYGFATCSVSYRWFLNQTPEEEEVEEEEEYEEGEEEEDEEDLLRLRSACSSRSIGRREASIHHGHWRSGGSMPADTHLF